MKRGREEDDWSIRVAKCVCDECLPRNKCLFIVVHFQCIYLHRKSLYIPTCTPQARAPPQLTYLFGYELLSHGFKHERPKLSLCGYGYINRSDGYDDLRGVCPFRGRVPRAQDHVKVLVEDLLESIVLAFFMAGADAQRGGK